MPTPEQLRDKLIDKLGAQARRHARFDAYYTGDHPLPDAPPGARAEYLRLMRLARSNWMELVVDAVAERLVVDGVRFGNQAADVDIWRTIWQPNALDAEHGDVHTEALIGGTAAVMVWPNTTDANGRPTITTEHPTEVYVELDPALRRRARAGVKVYTDDDTVYATLWTARDGDTPATVYKWSRPAASAEWQHYAADGDPDWTFENPLGEVPLVAFNNKRRMIGAGVSELAGGITDIQDRINETIFGRLTAGRFAAFRQRWATGMDIPVDPQTNKPVEPFKSAIDRLWMAEDKDVKFGEFSATDLAPYIAGVEADIQHLAAISRTPPHYLLGQSGAFPSGESLKATETGLVKKVEKRQLAFGESWEDVIRLGLVAMEDARGADDTLEVIWRDPESKGLGELVDALVKLKTLGVPDEALWERYGASQLEIARWRGQAARARLAAAAAAPPAAPPPPAVPPAPATPPAAGEELEPATA
jgi:hypothetical protein